MKRVHTHSSVARYVAKYRVWCRFFPAAFTKQFGTELEQVLQTSLEEAEEKYGEKGVQAEYRAAVADVIPAILHEQLTSLPTLQRMFSGGNVLWRLYVLLYWPLVGLGALGLTSVSLTPLAATFLVALYLTAHLAIWFATASVRLSVVIVLTSAVLVYIQQFGGFVFAFQSSAYRSVVDAFSFISVVLIAVAPYIGSLIVHVRKDRAMHQKVRLLSAEELMANDERRRQKRYRRNTVALCTLFALCMVNVAFLVVDATKAERVWNSGLLYPPYPAQLQDLKRSDNMYYSLMMIDGPKAPGDNQHPTYALFKEVATTQKVTEETRQRIEQLASPLAGDFALFAEAATKPYFLHPSLNGRNGWPIQNTSTKEYPPLEIVNFRQLAVLYAVLKDAQGDTTGAQRILLDSVTIGKRMAGASPNEGWYWSAMSFIGDVRVVLPLVSAETREVVAKVLPTTEEVLTLRKSYLENYALIAMAETQRFENENSLVGLTLFYLPNQTKLDLESTILRLQKRTLSCEATVEQQKRDEWRYGEGYSEWNGFTDYVLPRVLTHAGVNGQGKGHLQSLFQYTGEDRYFHYALAVPECEALGFKVVSEQ